MSSNILYVGVKGHVAAIDKATGGTLWKTKLKSGLTSGERFVSLLVQDGRVYAHTYGEVFGLDQATGAVLWNNRLEGLGYDIATLATEGVPSSPLPAIVTQRKNRDSDAGTAVVVGDGS